MEGHYVIFFLLTAHEKECLNVGHHVAEEKLDTKVKYTILHNLVLTLTLSKFKVNVCVFFVLFHFRANWKPGTWLCFINHTHWAHLPSPELVNLVFQTKKKWRKIDLLPAPWPWRQSFLKVLKHPGLSTLECDSRLTCTWAGHEVDTDVMFRVRLLVRK